MATALDKPPVTVERTAVAQPRTGWRKYWHLYAAISPSTSCSSASA